MIVAPAPSHTAPCSQVSRHASQSGWTLQVRYFQPGSNLGPASTNTSSLSTPPPQSLDLRAAGLGGALEGEQSHRSSGQSAPALSTNLGLSHRRFNLLRSACEFVCVSLCVCSKGWGSDTQDSWSFTPPLSRTPVKAIRKSPHGQLSSQPPSSHYRRGRISTGVTASGDSYARH